MYRIALVCTLLASADGAFIGASMKSGFLGKIARRSLEATVLPDPFCKTGIVSLKADDKKPQSCCAGYCGECGDHPTCEKVRGQSSRNACCKSAVYDLRCGGGAPANDCVKKCSESVPPCIMDKDEKAMSQHANNAADDCTSAVSKWRMMAENAIKPDPYLLKPYELLIKQSVCPQTYSSTSFETGEKPYNKGGPTLEACAESCKEKGYKIFSFVTGKGEYVGTINTCTCSKAEECGKIAVDGIVCVDTATRKKPCLSEKTHYLGIGRHTESYYGKQIHQDGVSGNIYRMK